MKMLFVSNLYGENARGGAERIVGQEAEALVAAGHDVVVVSGERKRDIPKGVCLPGEPWRCLPPGSPEEVAAAYAVAVKRTATAGKPRSVRYHPPNIYFYSDDRRHGYLSRLAWHFLDIFNGGSAQTFGRILALERPDVVHTHNLMGLGFLIPALLRRRKVRHVHTVHDVQLLHPSGLLSPNGRVGAAERIPQAVYIALMRSLFGSPETVIFPSEFLRDEHVRRGFFRGSRIEVVRNPAPEVSLAARAVPSAPSFLFVGQLERHKGIDLLLSAWSRWDDKGSATLEIAGDGTLAEELRRRVGTMDGVRLLGKLDHEAVLEALARSAYLIFPSIVIENAPAAIMESLSRGTPVVAASVGGVPEIVIEGDTGFLFSPGDEAACLAALRRAEAALPEWNLFFERCMKTAQEYSLAKHVERIVALYAGNEAA